MMSYSYFLDVFINIAIFVDYLCRVAGACPLVNIQKAIEHGHRNS
jgi:hypothetical protein